MMFLLLVLLLGVLLPVAADSRPDSETINRKIASSSNSCETLLGGLLEGSGDFVTRAIYKWGNYTFKC